MAANGSPSSCPPEFDPTTSESLAMIARSVQPGSQVLELGPGPGILTRHLSQALGCQVDCVERSPEMAAQARPFARDVWEDDLDVVDLTERTRGRVYDLVVAADVLEHLRDPARTLRQCRQLLAPDAQLAVSLPNVGHAAVVLELLRGRFPYGSFGILDRTHRWFFTRESVLSLLGEAGFRVQELYPHIRMPEATEFHQHFDRLSASLRAELLHHEDALTYQFIALARPAGRDERDTGALSAQPIEPALRFCANVYWGAPGGVTSEDRHVAQFGSLGVEHQQLVFDLPDDEPIGILRFDPVEGPGFVRLHSIEVRAGNESVVRLDSPSAIANTAQLRGLSALSGNAPSFLAEGDDPFLEIPLAKPLPVGPGRQLVVEMDWPASRDYAIAQERLDCLTRSEATLQRELHELRLAHAKEIDTLRDELTEMTSLAEKVQGMLKQVFDSKGWRLLEGLRALKPGARR